jgi:hypothetical protein
MLLRFLGRICGDAVGSAARRLRVRNPPSPLYFSLRVAACVLNFTAMANY